MKFYKGSNTQEVSDDTKFNPRWGTNKKSYFVSEPSPQSTQQKERIFKMTPYFGLSSILNKLNKKYAVPQIVQQQIIQQSQNLAEGKAVFSTPTKLAPQTRIVTPSSEQIGAAKRQRFPTPTDPYFSSSVLSPLWSSTMPTGTFSPCEGRFSPLSTMSMLSRAISTPSPLQARPSTASALSNMSPVHFTPIGFVKSPNQNKEGVSRENSSGDLDTPEPPHQQVSRDSPSSETHSRTSDLNKLAPPPLIVSSPLERPTRTPSTFSSTFSPSVILGNERILSPFSPSSCSMMNCVATSPISVATPSSIDSEVPQGKRRNSLHFLLNEE